MGPDTFIRNTPPSVQLYAMGERAAKNAQPQANTNSGEENVYADEHIPGLTVPKVIWYRHKGLRKLYAIIPILFLNATINGYDSSLLNGLQTLHPWQTCKLSS